AFRRYATSFRDQERGNVEIGGNSQIQALWIGARSFESLALRGNLFWAVFRHRAQRFCLTCHRCGGRQSACPGRKVESTLALTLSFVASLEMVGSFGVVARQTLVGRIGDALSQCL